MEKYKRIHKELKYRVHMCFNCSRMSQKEAFSIIYLREGGGGGTCVDDIFLDQMTHIRMTLYL